MAVLSGKGGTVTWNSGAVSQILSWTCNETVVDSSFGSSSTSGWKNRVAGTRDWSGSFRALYDTTIAPTVGQGTATGSAVSLVLGIAASESLTGNAMVTGVEMEVDVDNGTYVAYVVSFGGNGELTRT